MTVQLHPSETASVFPSSLVEKGGVTEPEYAVLQHLTAAWNAFLRLPAERVEYVVAFQTGCQQLQKQIMERGENRSGLPVPIPPLEGVASRPVLAVTIEERKRRRDEKHVAAAKARRARQMAEDPEGVRAKEREKWRRQQDRKREKAAAEKIQGATLQGRQSRKPQPKKATGAKTRAEQQRERYASDPEYRAARQRANKEWRVKNAYHSPPRSAEALARQKVARQEKMATDPIYAEQQRALKRASNAKYKAALRALKASKAQASEVRLYHLRSDPIYAAAHAALPLGMAEHHRADIVSDIIVSVLEKRIALADVGKAARSFIAAHHRQAETYATVSLDAPIGDGKVTMHDFISEGMWESGQADE